MKKYFLGVRPNLGSDQNSENSSTLGLDYTVKNSFRIFLFDTIQEPMERRFQNTPYFGQRILKVPELWKVNKCAKNIALPKVRGILKTSFHWLLNGIKRKILNFFLTV